MYKVIHLTSAHPSNDARILAKECGSLAKVGMMVYLVAMGDSYQEAGVQVVGCGVKASSRLKRMFFDVNKVTREAIKLDGELYHLHDPELLRVALKLKRLGKKVIYDSHEDTGVQISTKQWIIKPLRKLMTWGFLAYQRHVLSQLDGLISVTPHIVDKLLQINPNTTMITNYPIINPQPVSEMVKTEPMFVFAGRFAPKWSQQAIVKAINRLPQAKYYIYGPESPGYLNQIIQDDLHQRITYFGKIPYREIDDKLRSAYCGMALCQFTANTNFQNGTLGVTKLLEYMAAGIPVICANSKLWVEVMEQHQCGIAVDPNDDEAIYQAMDHLVKDPVLAHQMGINGRKAVEKQYNWEVEAKRLVEFYHHCFHNKI